MTLTLSPASAGIRPLPPSPSPKSLPTHSLQISTPTILKPEDKVVIHEAAPKIRLRHDPLFDRQGLTPSVKHTPQDVTQFIRLNFQQTAASSRQTIENSRLSLLKRTPEERQAFFRAMEEYLPTIPQQAQKLPAKPSGLKGEKNITSPFMYFVLTKLGAVVANRNQKVFDLMSPYATAIWNRRFIKNPQGGVVALKNKQKEIIGSVGFNQFQNTHDHQISLGDMKAIDPKHALEVGLYVKPEYRNMGVATALRKTMLDYARQKGYTHIWSTTEKNSASHRINEKLGYQLAKADATFKEAPAFTPDKMKALIDEYNVGTRQLSWLKIPHFL